MPGRGPTTNPAKTAQRIHALKKHLVATWDDLAELFGTAPSVVKRWGYGQYAPNLKYQRALLYLERKHGLRA